MGIGNGVHGIGVKISFVFSPAFLEDDVLGNFRDFEADLLLAVDEIPRVENYYESVYQTNEHVLVVDVDRGGKILKIDSLVIDASFTMFLTSIAGLPGIFDRFKYQVILARIYLKLHSCLKTCFFQPCAPKLYERNPPFWKTRPT